MPSVKIMTDKSRIAQRINAGASATRIAVTNQVIEDSNYYCRQDQGMLIDSSLIASEPEKGLAIWDTPYAQKTYYTGKPSKDVNPNASLMWCEVAKQAHGGDWEKIADKAFKEGMG